jgi:hypothetical protein
MVLRYETPKAILVSEDEEHDGIWLPKSLVEFSILRKTKLGHTVVEVTLPESLAKEKGLI